MPGPPAVPTTINANTVVVVSGNNAAAPAGTGPEITPPITGTETDFEHPEGPVINPCNIFLFSFQKCWGEKNPLKMFAKFYNRPEINLHTVVSCHLYNPSMQKKK